MHLMRPMRWYALSMVVLLLVACSQPAATPTAAPAPAPTDNPAQSSEARIANAMSAAPMAISHMARIVDYPANPSDPLIELRPGNNGWTCFPDWLATPKNDPQCFDAMWMLWFEALNTGKEPNLPHVGIAYMLQGGQDASNTDPFATEPVDGQWIDSPPHVMFVSPHKLDPQRFSTDHHAGGPYVMWAGTPYEHIMMPVAHELVPQTKDTTASALSALPTALADGATILAYTSSNPNDPPTEARKGTNGWTCFSDWPVTPGNDPQCFDAVWMQWLDALINSTDPALPHLGVSYMLQGGQDASNTDPFAAAPVDGKWVDSPEHVMLVVPDPLDPKLFSTDHHSGGPYIMWAGTPYEHVMIPVR